ncbi:MAG TPA: zinc ribbon domain-containing protein [Candidatus Dormibacteraeota bacterium]|nr:zinc ribbon domain-containing protein [Candidatus Dormibacteraeota bacterium]
MSQIVSEIECPNCGAPLKLSPGEIVATCRYCGYTSVVGANTPFQLEHSLILNEFDTNRIAQDLQDWMRSGFMKPGDLAKKSKIMLLELRYLPFWLVPMTATSTYEGVLERISPPTTRKGIIQNDYDWLVLGRKAAEFPTREYKVPSEGKIPFDFAKIEPQAIFLNSELDSSEAILHAKDEVQENQRFLLKQEVDQVTKLDTTFNVEKPSYLHAPLWFAKYEYKGRSYNAIMDGSSGSMIWGDIPQTEFKMI